MNPILTKLAEISPLSYADRILERNEELLRKLILLEPYVGEDKGIPEDVAKEVVRESNFGCPHCDQNGCRSECLWRKVYANVKGSCFNVPFLYGMREGITLREVEHLESIRVQYWDTSEEIEIEEYITREDFNKCVDFVKAHIEWAKLPIWGSEYKRVKNEN